MVNKNEKVNALEYVDLYNKNLVSSSSDNSNYIIADKNKHNYANNFILSKNIVNYKEICNELFDAYLPVFFDPLWQKEHDEHIEEIEELEQQGQKYQYIHKKYTMKFKNESETIKFDDAQKEQCTFSVLKKNIVVIDIDKKEIAQTFEKILLAYDIDTYRSYTLNGAHFFFKNNKGLTAGDNCFNSLGFLKLDPRTKFSCERKLGKNLPIVGKKLYELPSFFQVSKTKTCGDVSFIGMKAGDGRDNSLHSHALKMYIRLHMSHEQVLECLNIINHFELSDKLSDEDIERIGRYDEKTKNFVRQSSEIFDHTVFANSLIEKYHIKNIMGAFFFFDGVAYRNNHYNRHVDLIKKLMIDELPNIKQRQRNETSDYIQTVLESIDIKGISQNQLEYVVFKNGVLNLNTLELLEHDPKYMIMNVINHNYVKDCQRSDFVEDCLNTWSNGDPIVRTQLLECIGYTFYRNLDIRATFMIVGSASGGKSTFTRLIAEILGSDNYSTLKLEELSDRFNTIELKNKLANIGDDISDGYLNDLSKFKSLATGEETKAEEKGLKTERIKSFATHIYTLNEIPHFKDSNDGVLDRLQFIQFNNKHLTSYNGFTSKLFEEKNIEYVIKLAVDALIEMLQRRAPTMTEKTRRLKEEIRRQNNPIMCFLEEYNIDSENIIGQKFMDVFNKYRDEYCSRNDIRCTSTNKFKEKIQSLFNVKTIEDRKRQRIFVKDI